MQHEPFNSLTKQGTVGKLLGKIMDDIKPDAAYFSLEDGKRSAMMVININKPGNYVRYAEPFFYNLMLRSGMKYL